ncbi:MAG: sorbosone dehydrogenase family protein [Flavobacterium sp.]|uniref:PQQ-dependent sugar dehydrogenase n=1 Tax=Flavobacterium sp. Leaf359 TaxID=1736351 RepID=UPI0006FC4AE6|nr:sorbosone dehydrogenase family protein [Flavobacterium sp. Leaf359]KQS48768.1 L-sorbosone dehydrogenase [Flavobacterium sp. Leaf359]MBU7569813.1 sorbosone dehydrogenase family protein [Flavobacterium sp.]PZO26444.1 MAG: sorbosone dehydrogenase family protein [Flavobacteriaceae bacterium]
MKTRILPLLSCIAFSFLSCNGQEKKPPVKNSTTIVKTAVGDLELPAPYATESARKISRMKEWPEGVTPKAPEGFVVTKFADGLKNPRWTYIAPNNDIFVVESNTFKSANQITIFRDKDGDGVFETREIFKDGLNMPFGMLILDNYFYIANTDGLFRFPYSAGDLKLRGNGTKILELPAGGYNNHWTRNLLANADGSKIYVSVGSASNNAEHGMEVEKRRANILEINPDGTGEQIYANGLRNPVGMDWNPANNELWTAVNERDDLGDELVPDYITSVKRGGFYGWPYSYYGQIPDPRMKGQGKELVAKAIIPDVSVGAHTASLGFAFYNQDVFPAKYRNGAFVGQHGSWNRSKLSGYKVLFVPFKNGKPSGKPEDFLTGFIANEEKAEVYGRPVAVTVMKDGSLLVNDDSGNTIWRVAFKK